MLYVQYPQGDCAARHSATFCTMQHDCVLNRLTPIAGALVSLSLVSLSLVVAVCQRRTV